MFIYSDVLIFFGVLDSVYLLVYYLIFCGRGEILFLVIRIGVNRNTVCKCFYCPNLIERILINVIFYRLLI